MFRPEEAPYRRVLYPRGLFHDIGVNYCLEEGNQGTHGDLSELKQWLIGHLLWNPEQPLEPLLDRFFTGFYGAGAPWARRYFEELHALPRDQEKEPIKMWINWISFFFFLLRWTDIVPPFLPLL